MVLLADAEKTLIHWVREREAIRRQKEAGLPPPWTEDPILATYRFCNVRREDDKVTRWINKHIRQPWNGHAQMPTMLALARHLNRIETLEKMVVHPSWPGYMPNDQTLGWPQANAREMSRYLDTLPRPIYNNAYMIRAESDPSSYWFGVSKQNYVCEAVCRAVSLLFVSTIYPNIDHKLTLAGVCIHLQTLRGLGEFMAYQITVDLRHTRLLSGADDASSFAAYGPGTRRGFNRMFGRPLNFHAPRDWLTNEALPQVRERIFEATGMYLEASDVCNVMCEVDKYMRGGGKQKYQPA